jgi:hypothetical protein
VKNAERKKRKKKLGGGDFFVVEKNEIFPELSEMARNLITKF